ncbi:Uncharacterised protein [Chromobacterium violaceum]|uniref:Cellulose biosynthesis protein BcsF n=1 Tax=Chromobacterium violaceum TaxID=536 RepID=A0A3S4LL89_CHRVL|nr:Uncharacterised protein [Chromobacterium violaceum]
MFDPQMNEIQFLLLMTALAAAAAGYLARAWLAAWLTQHRQRRLRHFRPHPYRPPPIDLKEAAIRGTETK